MVDDIKQVMKPMHLLFLIEEVKDLLLGLPNVFNNKNMATPLNFAEILKMRRRKNQASCMRGKRRVRMILSFSPVMLKKLYMMKCGKSTVDVAIM